MLLQQPNDDKDVMNRRNITITRHMMTNRGQRPTNGAAKVANPTLKSIMLVVKQNDVKKRLRRANSKPIEHSEVCCHQKIRNGDRPNSSSNIALKVVYLNPQMCLRRLA